MDLCSVGEPGDLHLIPMPVKTKGGQIPERGNRQPEPNDDEILGIQAEDSGTIDDGVGSDLDEGGQKCIKNAAFTHQTDNSLVEQLTLKRKRSKGKSLQIGKANGNGIASTVA